MPAELPPSIDPVAAARWHAWRHAESPWLHEEVGRRMEDRLQWIKLVPSAWVDWEPARGGLRIHDALVQRYPQAACHVVEVDANAALSQRHFRKRWWRQMPWDAPRPAFGQPAAASVQMVWANMALHMAADPQALIGLWHGWLATGGFLMFSCLGPDTLRELRDVYKSRGWPPPAHVFTDMHDWGDMLVNTGFAEPVMDMEHITLTFENPQRALLELRQLGRNLHHHRPAGLRGRQWHQQLLQAVGAAQGVLPQRQALGFEVIYGHAMKAAPRLALKPETSLPLDEMRRILRAGNRAGSGPA